MRFYNEVSWLIAFTGGVFSFLSPCVFPLVPAYFSYISGVTVKDYQCFSRIRILVGNLLFVAGFSAIFVTMGATVTSVGNFLFNYREILQRISGIIVILLGLHLTGIFKIKFLYYTKGFHLPSWGGYFSPLLLGVAFGTGWTPCVGPILSSILILAGSSKTVLRGMTLLTFYSAGLGIPFLISGLLVNRFLVYFHRLQKYFSIISLVSGIFLAGVGIAIFTGYFMRLSSFLPAR